MAAQDDLWAAVAAAYPSAVLISLTNPEDTGATSVSTAWGTAAALASINLWPVYAQDPYDELDAAHIQVGIRATIAMLFERGGSSTEIAKIKWEDVFSDEGLLSKIMKTGARSRRSPKTNSGTAAPSSELLSDGTRPLGWSDTSNIPTGVMPVRRSSIR